MNEVADPKQARQWAMFMHFSVFLGYIVPLGGLVAPIVMWQMKKNEYEGIDEHGKNILNFLISFLIYSGVCAILVLAFIGVLLLIPLAIAGIVFPIIAAIKANNGEVWKYPLTIQFIK